MHLYVCGIKIVTIAKAITTTYYPPTIIMMIMPLLIPDINKANGKL